MFGNGTDFKNGRTAIEVEAYFPDGIKDSHCLAVPCHTGNEQFWEPKASELLLHVLGSDREAAGLIGIIVDENEADSCPCLTMLVSGPNGAIQAAQVIKQALSDCGLNNAIVIRTVREGAAGVIKIPFHPEIYHLFGNAGFGVDWKMWAKLGAADPEFNWSAATLIWCDSVISAVD